MLDEPVGGLNPTETRALMDLIVRLRDEDALTLLLVEHDMSVVMRVSGRGGSVPGRRGGRVNPLLQVVDVSVSYGPRPALDRVSLEVGRGEIVTLLGANGAGKSTTLRTISGLVRPTRGRILYDGRDVMRATADAIVAAGLAHVPEGREIFPAFTVEENLLVGGHTVAPAPAGERQG